jgi:hypothetical protein
MSGIGNPNSFILMGNPPIAPQSESELPVLAVEVGRLRVRGYVLQLRVRKR